MKRTNLKWVAVGFVAGASMLIAPVSAGVDVRSADVAKAIQQVPVSELAAKAVGLISEANKATRESVAIAAVEAVMKKQPAVATAVVSAISKAYPELAAKVAAKAAALSPEQTLQISRAAALAARQQAPQVAASVAKVAPQSALKVTQTVMFAVPELEMQTQDAVVAVVPPAVRSSVRTARSASSGGSGSSPLPGIDPPDSTTGNEIPGSDYARP